MLVACGSRPPLFEPLPVTSRSDGGDIRVDVRPLDTRFGSEDRREYGIDVGAYLSAFLVRVDNRTAALVAVDPAASRLEEPSGQAASVLSDEELVQRYRRGGVSAEGIEVVAKAPSVVKREMEILRAMRLKAVTLEPGRSVEGVLFFPPASLPCGRAFLTMRGISVVDDPLDLPFRFPLTTCPAAQGAPAGN